MTDRPFEKNKWRERFSLYAPLFLWISIIFFLSSSQGASTRTSLIIRPILEFLFPAASPETLSFYHGIIRKFAHLTEYGVLGLLAMRAFATGRAVLTSAVILTGVAAIDEINQSLNPARTGSIIDVSIDLAGGATAILLVTLLRGRKRR